MREISLDINAAVRHIRQFYRKIPSVGLILGSGLGEIADLINKSAELPYDNIPGFLPVGVEGHAGQLICGNLGPVEIIAMQGRFHYYEGWTMQQLVFPVRVMHALGVRSLIVTAASGGVNTEFRAGDMMIITDHINFIRDNPFRVSGTDPWREEAIEVHKFYDMEYAAIARHVATRHRLPVREGTYFYFSGPNYETAAEVRMVQLFGADTAGMSTVPEVMQARSLGMRVLGITYISNMGTGITQGPITHAHVVETLQLIKTEMSALLTDAIREIGTLDHA